MKKETFMSKKTFEQRKQMIYDFVRTEFYVPMKEKELAIVLQVEPMERPVLKQILEELLQEGAIEITKRGKYKVPDNLPMEGVFIANEKGFGFVEVEGEKEDYFVPQEYVKDAFHMDRVTFKRVKSCGGKRCEVEIVSIVERGIKTLVGVFEKSNSFGFVIPDQSKIPVDIFIPQEKIGGAVTGHKVVAEIVHYGDERRKPEGRIVEILGHVNDPGIDVLSVIKTFDIPQEFKERTLNQAMRVSNPVSDADRQGRMDLRNVPMVTIDGEDAKDLDDAISLSVSDGLFHLGVHIADVANYVQENSALDKEALERGTSVYLADRVIPMLPQTLSNGICSLNAGEDRLALSCLMTIDGAGNVVDYKIKETVINVNRRMSYTNVAKILEDKEESLWKEYREFVPMFEQMEELSGILRLKRKSRGSVDFDMKECKIHLDAKGRVTEILPYERNVATKMIEDFMLIANETVAQHFYWMEVPFVYRTHDKPDPEKVQKLSAFISSFGYSLKVGQGEIHPKELQKLLLRIEGTKEEIMISRLMLRSMKRAQYQEECNGHFGLACQYYCHFTSPIRRYPDLQIHRIIKESLRGRLNEKRLEHYNAILPEVCVKSSKLERRAEEAEREVEKLKKAQYMREHIGQEYEGMISGITSWGIYVELPDTVEGLVRVADIPGDFYVYREENYEMVGQNTKKIYKLGDRVKVWVKEVDLSLKTIDFGMLKENVESE